MKKEKERARWTSYNANDVCLFFFKKGYKGSSAGVAAHECDFQMFLQLWAFKGNNISSSMGKGRALGFMILRHCISTHKMEKAGQSTNHKTYSLLKKEGNDGLILQVDATSSLHPIN